jgi:hypothetical protein
MANPLLPHDIIGGAWVRDRPNLFVLGCYDRRITFYSQQVRALSLVHALHDQGYLNDNPHIAVVGAGAAGLTVAAAAALVSSGPVMLFESAAELLPVQSATIRRKLDPHIYDWPALDTTDPVANLPILDWEAGPSRSVRDDVVLEFEDVAARMGGRLQRRLRHQVTAIRQVAGNYELVFTNLDAPPRHRGDEQSEGFNMVFLAVGFGMEPPETVQGIPNASYWSDAGVPVGEFQGRPRPRLFVSGSGDGGLIDFVAAGSRDFSHAAMIELITRHPGIDDIKANLADIDVRARHTEADGQRFDFIATYDAEILDRLNAMGLIAAVGRKLRPGVQLNLQTRHAEMFEVSTSTLNRLAAYATIKACEADPQCHFRHIPCADFHRVAAPVPCAEPATYWIDCAGNVVGADSIIIRRGPLREDVRGPFEEHLVSFEATHKEWLDRHGDATRVPILSKSARRRFEEAARAADIPLSRRRQRQAAPRLPATVQLRSVGARVRWSGAITPPALAAAWNDDQPFEIILPDGPLALGAAAGAMLRVACHGRQVKLHADPALWREHVHRLSVDSPHADGMTMPVIVAGNPGGAGQDPEVMEAARLARVVNQALDGWMHDRLHRHLEGFLTTGADPGKQVGLLIARDLRAQMTRTWADWHVAFADDPALLNHFLRLMVCAVDDEDDRDVAQVLVGPTKLSAIIRGTAVSLAIAASWETTGPKSAHPGNLLRQRGERAEWTGHSCAADRIDGKAMPLCAGSYMWQTQFVILTVQGTVEVARRAETAFTQIETKQPALSETDGSGPVMMSISKAFSDAVEAGAERLGEMLAEIEARHFARLEEAIQKVAQA